MNVFVIDRKEFRTSVNKIRTKEFNLLLIIVENTPRKQAKKKICNMYISVIHAYTYFM